MDTLNSLNETLNADLQAYIGHTVTSALEVCQDVRKNITKGDFYNKLMMNNMQELIAFKEGIENLQYIFLKTSGDSETQCIIKLNVVIEYFDESNISAGGILASLKSELVDVGEQMKSVSLTELASFIRLSALQKKKTAAMTELSQVEARATELKKLLESYAKEEESLKAKSSSGE